MLPRRIRWMAGLCAFISALTMWGATTDFLTALQLSAVREELGKATATDFIGVIALELRRAELAAWSDMRGVRIFIAFALSVTAGLAFAASLRILLPMGLRREGMRGLLTRALLWTAGARVVTGAADAGAKRYAGEALVKSYHSLPNREAGLAALPEWMRASFADPESLSVMPAAQVASAAVFTLVVTALFIMFWRYFGRDDVKQALTAADDTPPPSKL